MVGGCTVTGERVTSRRDFLRQAPTALGLLAPGLIASRDERPASGDLIRLGRRAMGCRFEVILPAADAPLEAAREALDLVDDLEQQMTIYREDSEISAINRSAARGPVSVEPRLFALLQLAARLGDETGGAFDITAGPLSRLWREGREPGTPPAADEIAAVMSRVGMARVRLDGASQTIAFGRDGVELDLGAIGKGYALDRVAELLAARGVRAALVHGGQSSVLAIGRPPWDDAWTLDVQHPLRPGETIAALRLRDRAMGTSAVGDFCVVEGGGRGHLLDPRTGRPAEGPLGATALASTAAEADALATAFCVMCVEETRAYCARHPGVGVLLVPADAEPVVIALGDEEVQVVR